MEYTEKTRPEEVPQFLPCGHNAHWEVWHSLAKGERCVFCRAESAELRLREATELLRQADSLYRNYGLIANPPGGVAHYPEYKGDICCGKWMNGVSAFLDKMAEDGVRKMGFTLDQTRESDK